MTLPDNEQENLVYETTEPLLQSDRDSTLSSNSKEEERKEAIQFYVEQLTLLFYPLVLTFALTCWIETTLAIDNTTISNPLMYYDELPSDTISARLGGSILNAVIVVCSIAAMTFMLVLCFYYRLYKILFLWLGLSVLSILGVTASSIWIEMMNVYQLPLDYLTMVFCTWNVSVVGLVAIFWNSPLWLQQEYLIVISAATSISLLRMPPWTTWTVLIAVALYDLFAVLCPSGPLHMLITMAEERQERIPALIYSAGMASFDGEHDLVGGYRTQESRHHPQIKFDFWPSWLSFGQKSSSRKYQAIDNNEEEEELLREGVENATLSVNELSDLAPVSSSQRRGQDIEVIVEDEDKEDDEMNAIKLGLGDFIFYSVLVGKASRTDAVTLCLCIIAILTGLSLTILILTLRKKALPALPISILFGSITYALAYYMASPMIIQLSLQVVLI